MEHLREFWNTLDPFWRWLIPIVVAAVITGAIKYLMSKSANVKNITQNQKSGDNSISVQIGNIEKK
ncbi:MAG: hypothetical protein WC043_04985 [Pseudobdellovibrionaceae bacterium]